MSQTFDILGMGWSLPKTEIDNEFLHKEVGLRIPPRWAMSRLGISKRYSCLSKEYIVQTKNADPVEAMKNAIANGVTDPFLDPKSWNDQMEKELLFPVVGFVN